MIIRDAEVENTIRLYLKPILAAAGLPDKDVKIYLIEDDSINAFVSGGMQIFIHTGLLKKTATAEEVIGVLAHEVGHIVGGHLSRLRENRDAARTRYLIAMLLGAPLAAASGRPDAGVAAAALGRHIAERGFLTYTREMERAADQAGADFLDHAGISPRGYIDLLDRLEARARLYQDDPDPYMQSHPLTEDRRAFMHHRLETSPVAGRPLPAGFAMAHARARAKLIAYENGMAAVRQLWPESDKDPVARYARAIALMMEHRSADALALVDGLIAESPQDPFYHELKGDILRRAGRLKEAIVPYRAALAILPWAALIHLNVAQILLEPGFWADIDSTTTEPRLEEALAHLEAARRYEPDLPILWRLLTVAHGQRGERGRAALAQAEGAIRAGRMEEAGVYADRALTRLAQGSPSWQRAGDIAAQAMIAAE